MPKDSKAAVSALLLVASAAAVGWPLYEERLWTGSGPPQTTVWCGVPRGLEFFRTVVVTPEFWPFAALSLSAVAWAMIDRRVVAILSLAPVLAGLAALEIFGTTLLRGTTGAKLMRFMGQVDSGPEPAFYVAVVSNALAAAVILLSPRSASPPPGRP